MKILFIHPRRGLFQLTRCSDCGHTFECENCDANLTTYRQNGKVLELVCHQCQSYYKYPQKCPKCDSEDIFSKFGGMEDLVESLEKDLQVEVDRFDKKIIKKKRSSVNDDSAYKPLQAEIYTTTRIFDPSIEYAEFDKIVFVQAENLVANLDYLVQEEAMKSVLEIFNQIDESTEVIFDTATPELDMFQALVKLNEDYSEPNTVATWFVSFLDEEKKIRKLFGFPPYKNLLLITSQEDSKNKAWDIIKLAQKNIQSFQGELDDLTITNPYPARFLKRKNKYSYHLLIKFPRQYKNFAEFRDKVLDITDSYNLQVRLNPRHLF